jgi:hypothetical protein
MIIICVLGLNMARVNRSSPSGRKRPIGQAALVFVMRFNLDCGPNPSLAAIANSWPETAAAPNRPHKRRGQ